jgi:hypothetical protein
MTDHTPAILEKIQSLEADLTAIKKMLKPINEFVYNQNLKEGNKYATREMVYQQALTKCEEIYKFVNKWWD